MSGREKKGNPSSIKTTDNPYENFVDNLHTDEKPNFLRYTLCVLEKHSYAEEAALFKEIRLSMEKTYNITDVSDPWIKK